MTQFTLETATQDPEWDITSIIQERDNKLFIARLHGKEKTISNQKEFNADLAHSMAGFHIKCMLLYQTNSVLTKIDGDHVYLLQDWLYEDIVALENRDEKSKLSHIQEQGARELLAFITL